MIEQQNAVCAVLADDRKYWCKMPSEEEFSTIENMVQILEPLSYALSGEFHVTVSALHPLHNHILNKILLGNPEDRATVLQMKTKIKEDLERRYSNHSQSLLDKCSYLDPTFREKYLSDKVIYQVKMEAIEILQQSDTQEVVASEVEVTLSEITEIPRQKRMKGLSAVLQHCLGTSSSCNIEDISNEENFKERLKDMKNIHQWKWVSRL